MDKKKVIALGGDGVGPEVIDAVCYVLEKSGFGLDIIKSPSGETAIKEYKSALPDETRELCEQSDAVLFGAVGHPASAVILLYLRWGLDNYVNMRPIKYYEGARSPLRDPSGIDFIILRENSEGLYPPREGDLPFLAETLPDFKETLTNRLFSDFGPGKFTIRVISQKATERLAVFACEYALKRKKLGYPGKITCVTKSNVLPKSCGLFQQIVEEEVGRHPELSYEHYYVDDMARRLVRYPSEMDVIVTSNLFGDILSDESSELVGGLGLAPSGCVGGRVPYFESVHGSAPKYAGKNVINPTATMLSAKMMLDYLNMVDEANALEKAVAAVYKEGKILPRDQGGNATTTDFAEAVLRNIK